MEGEEGKREELGLTKARLCRRPGWLAVGQLIVYHTAEALSGEEKRVWGQPIMQSLIRETMTP